MVHGVVHLAWIDLSCAKWEVVASYLSSVVLFTYLFMLSLRDNTFVFVFSSLMAYTQAQNTRWYSEQYFDPVQHAKAEHHCWTTKVASSATPFVETWCGERKTVACPIR